MKKKGIGGSSSSSRLVRVLLSRGRSEQLLELAALLAHPFEDPRFLDEEVVGSVELEELAVIEDEQTVEIDDRRKSVGDRDLEREQRAREGGRSVEKLRTSRRGVGRLTMHESLNLGGEGKKERISERERKQRSWH